MPLVTMPDGAVVDMPENPTAEQLSALQEIQSGKPAGGVMAETERVLDKGVRGGLTSLPGLILEGLKANSDLPPAQAVQGGGASLLLNALTKMGKAALPQATSEAITNAPTGGMTSNLQTLGGTLPPVSTPQTETGKYAGAGLEGLVSAVSGGGVGSVAGKAATGAAGGLGGEGSAHLFGDNILSRLLGGLAGGGAVTLGRGLIPNAEKLVQQSTAHMTPADWARAERTGTTLKDEGIPFLQSQTLGPRSTLADVVETASSNPKVRPKIVSAVGENSSEKARKAFENLMSSKLPLAMDERGAVLDDVQTAAEKIIADRTKAANAAFEKVMPPAGTQYPPSRALALRDQLLNLAKSSRFGPTTDAGKSILKYADDLLLPGSGKLDTSKANPTMLLRAKQAGTPLEEIAGVTTTREPLTDAHQINNLIKELNLKANGMNPDYKGLPVFDVKRIMKAGTPEFDAARQAKQDVMTTSVNPTKKSLVGQIADQGGGTRPDKITAKDTALNLVFPVDRPQPQAIIQMGKDVGGDAVGAMLREHLARKLQVATTQTGSAGTAAQQPFDFLKTVAGTNAQRQNLEAALKVTAESQGVPANEVRTGFYKLMRAMESTKDLKIAPGVDKVSLGQAAGTTLPGLAVAPQSRAARALWERATAKTYNQIADIVLSPDGLKELQRIARSPRPELARQLAVTTLTSALSGESRSE